MEPKRAQAAWHFLCFVTFPRNTSNLEGDSMGKSKLAFITAIILAAPLFSNAATIMVNNCVQREDQIVDVPSIKTFVAKVGGMDNLEGSWKLGGMAGALKRVVISFQSANDGMKALIEGLKTDEDASHWGAISVCDTVRNDTLQVKVLNTKDSLYMRKGSGNTLQLAQIQNGKVGTFYTFNKAN
jgi:hypothetical protein